MMKVEKADIQILTFAGTQRYVTNRNKNARYVTDTLLNSLLTQCYPSRLSAQTKITEN